MLEEDAIDISNPCAACAGTGYDSITKQLYDNFHSGDRWCHSLEQDEVDHLLARGRLFDFSDRPTAAEVNRWSYKGFGHDVVNRHLCTNFRATRLGVFGVCTVCGGSGENFH